MRNAALKRRLSFLGALGTLSASLFLVLDRLSCVSPHSLGVLGKEKGTWGKWSWSEHRAQAWSKGTQGTWEPELVTGVK